MINTTLIWFLLLPAALAIVIWWFVGKGRDGLIVSGVFALVSSLLVGGIFFGAAGVAVSDIEIWNGKVTGKTRVHDSYVRTYECNCTTSRDSKGNTTRSCSTCREDRYTVQWNVQSTVGSFEISKVDRDSRRVYLLPNPARYDAVVIGEPASRANRYTNYVQAVSGSLFASSSSALSSKFAGLLPAYPDQVHDFYRATHFVTPGYNVADRAAWNAALGEMLKDRGPSKQVNAIVVIAKTDDPDYALALRDHWEGVNKNDVVLVIGSATWPKIDFVEVLSWTKNEMFKVQLRDNVMASAEIKRDVIVSLLASQIDSNFERRRMREFEYLKAEIDPPGWLLITTMVLLIAGAAGTVFVVNGQSWRPRTRSFRSYR